VGDPLNVIVFGAHPDDCDIKAGGVAALFSQMGHKVKFVSLTNGNKGHHTMKPDELAARRKREMQEAGRILGVVYENLDNPDGELMSTIENRKAVIKLICDWKADIAISCRPYDYHPDHRNTAIIVQDAALK
jgi:LmbE family N-acetylglucosaminyl deacetylase